jgi:hypothetical protein
MAHSIKVNTSRCWAYQLPAIQELFPEYKGLWQEDKRGSWKDITDQRKFFEQLAIKLNIQKPEDWLNVQCKTILKEGGSFVNHYYKSSVIKGMIIFLLTDWKSSSSNIS